MNQLSYHVSNKRFVLQGFKYKGNLDKQILKTIKLIQNANSL